MRAPYRETHTPADFICSETCTNFLQSRFDAYKRGKGTVLTDERTSLADVELDVWEEMLVLARRQRNATRDACSLPPEIMASIFLILRDVWCPQGTASPTLALGSEGTNVWGTKYSLGWLTILAVCHSWRHVRLSHPRVML